MEGFKDRLLKDWHNKHIKTEPTIEELNAYRLLPKEIDRIRLSHFKKQTFSYYSENEGGSVSDLTDTHLLYVIREKEKKLLKYKNCDEYWLLITEGNFHAGSFDNITASKIDKTSFDRIFLLREGKNELITLF